MVPSRCFVTRATRGRVPRKAADCTVFSGCASRNGAPCTARAEGGRGIAPGVPRHAEKCRRVCRAMLRNAAGCAASGGAGPPCGGRPGTEGDICRRGQPAAGTEGDICRRGQPAAGTEDRFSRRGSAGTGTAGGISRRLGRYFLLRIGRRAPWARPARADIDGMPVKRLHSWENTRDRRVGGQGARYGSMAGPWRPATGER